MEITKLVPDAINWGILYYLSIAIFPTIIVITYSTAAPPRARRPQTIAGTSKQLPTAASTKKPATATLIAYRRTFSLSGVQTPQSRHAVGTKDAVASCSSRRTAPTWSTWVPIAISS